MLEDTIAREGVMLAISSPSGAGKSTLAAMLLQNETELSMSVSVTTRAPRPGEIDGKDYYFVDIEEFERLRSTDALLEWAEVFGNFYGTPRHTVEESIRQGQDVLFDVDWQGAQQIFRKLGNHLVRIFILPPSKEALLERLTGRGQDSAEVIESRMKDAHNEMSHWHEYDYVLINDDLEKTFVQLQNVLATERLRRERRTGLSSFVQGIM